MARILEKTVESVESFLSPFSTFYGFQSLIQKCIASKTKKEEETLIGGCLQLVKSKLGEPSPSHRSIINCLSFVVFADLLGYKAPFAHIHAVKLAGSTSILLKKLGYLFCSYLLEPTHELSLLMVNTILRDLSLQSSIASYDDSQDPFAVAAALAAACYLIPVDSISTILPHVLDKLNHPSPFVRGKAVSALQHLSSQLTGCRFFHTPEQLSSVFNGQPSALMCKLVTDPHPSVVLMSLQFVHFLASQLQHLESAGNVEDSQITVKVDGCVESEFLRSGDEDSNKYDASALKDFAPALVHIQKQILQGKIPEEYIFHSVPAPWVQISILKLLRLLKQEEIVANEVHSLLIETFQAASRKSLIGWAIVVEVVHTAVETHLPESSFSEIVDVLGKLVIDSGPGKDSIPKWLSSNLLHTSLSLLQLLGRNDISLVNQIITSYDLQDGLSGSVNHIDPSIRRLAVGLVTAHGSLTSSMKGKCWTAEKISLLLLEECLPKKLHPHGVIQPVDHWKKECLERIVQITSTPCEPSEGTSWQLAVLLRALPLAPDRPTAIVILDQIQRFLLPPREGCEEVGADNVPRDKVLKLLEKHCHSRCASSYLLELYIWVLSNFYYLLPDTCPLKALKMLTHLGQKVVFNNRKGNLLTVVDVLIGVVRGVMLITLKKLNFTNQKEEEWNEARELIGNFIRSMTELDGTPQLMDAYSELSRVLPHAQEIAHAMKESSVGEDSLLDFTLSFLDPYICKRLEGGANKHSEACQPFPSDCYNAELAISVRRQMSLGLPLHCHPWKVDMHVPEAAKDDFEFSASMSLTQLPSSCTPSSHGTSIPDEFLSLSMESQPKDSGEKDGGVAPMSTVAPSKIWTSSGRTINLDETPASYIPFSTFSLDQRTHLGESSVQPDLMSLLLHTGNSGVALDQEQAQPASSDPLDVLLSDGLHIGDMTT
ncbi:AP-4 complex subunit epsilon-1-like [Ischnura elegans]|uniref:AP-4 complex subunit epsilon-1-like n=1 Tax=Ischnura elegans TaxID=197161 RepID=UPI001ED88A5C|nr:AP-4 complex subunit epsilon-1-like [Ischnura elegans]